MLPHALSTTNNETLAIETTASPLTLATLHQQDRSDATSGLRSQFALPAAPAVKLEANSVGAMPVEVPARVAQLLQQGWRTMGRRGWSEADWLQQPALLGGAIAHLIGAGKDDVLVCDNTTVNLFKLLGHAWRGRSQGTRIVTEAGNFSTNLHVTDGFVRLLAEQGTAIELVRSPARDAVLEQLDERCAILLLTHTDYRYGHAWDIAATTRAAQAAGALVIWDLSHSAGALDVDLLGANADFAVGAGYKYLCGGPGAPAFVFVHPRHQQQTLPVIQGWMGHAGQPGLDPDYEPAAGVARMATGTPTVIANAAFSAAADIWQTVDRKTLGDRHRALGDTMIALLDEQCGSLGVELLSPRDPARRGGHLAFAHPGAGAIAQALLARGVVTSFRAPNAIRAGISPLYHNREDLWHAVSALRDILQTEEWRKARYQQASL